MTTTTAVPSTTLTGSNASVVNKINQNYAASQTAVANNTVNSNTAAAGQQQLTGNLNTFLNMLTAQLKNQDPLSPMDSTQFTNQLVQFSQVEQQINTNSNLESLIGLQKTSQQASAINYIGQTVSFSGSSLPLSNSQAAFSYTLPSQASSIQVQILDSNGKPVTTLSSPDGSAGTHTVSWDGTDSSGNKVADGTYSISITATDAKGNAITPTTEVYGVVSGVTSDSSGTQLELGDSGMTTSLGNILSIHLPMSQSASSGTSSGTSSGGSSGGSTTTSGTTG